MPPRFLARLRSQSTRELKVSKRPNRLGVQRLLELDFGGLYVAFSVITVIILSIIAPSKTTRNSQVRQNPTQKPEPIHARSRS